MSRIAVTGGSGFVGRHLVAALRERGDNVRILVHERPLPVELTDIESRQGDVRDEAVARDLVEACDSVVHLAPGLGPAPDAVDAIVAGTSAVVRAASDAGVKRFVLVSCLGSQAANRSPFYAAKWKAEQLVRGSGLPYVVLKPSLILGPGDGLTAPLGALLRTLPVVPIPGNGTHRQQPIDVEDVVRCILLSLERDDLLNMEISVGGSTFITPRQMTDLLAGALGVQRRKVRVPGRWLSAAAARVPDRFGVFSPARVAQLEGESAASPGIVESVFGFAPRPVVPRLRDYLAADTLA